jgi:hypothetical protein
LCLGQVGARPGGVVVLHGDRGTGGKRGCEGKAGQEDIKCTISHAQLYTYYYAQYYRNNTYSLKLFLFRYLLAADY